MEVVIRTKDIRNTLNLLTFVMEQGQQEFLQLLAVGKLESAGQVVKRDRIRNHISKIVNVLETVAIDLSIIQRYEIIRVEIR